MTIPETATFRYAQVLQSAPDPVQVRLDGTFVPLDFAPTSLVPVRVGDKVLVALYLTSGGGRQAVILGRVGGPIDQYTGVIDDVSKVSSAPGWSVGNFRYVRTNHMLQFICNIDRTGANVASTASGNITNQAMATLLDTTMWPLLDCGLTHAWGGIMFGGWVAQVNGTINLGSLPPNVPVNTGDTLYMSAVYPTALGTV